MITEKDFAKEIQGHFQYTVSTDVAEDCFELAREMATDFARWTCVNGYFPTPLADTGAVIWERSPLEIFSTDQLFQIYQNHETKV